MAFIKWHSSKFDEKFDRQFETYFNTVSLKIKDNLEKSEIWKSIIDNFKELSQNYKVKTGVGLFLSTDIPKVVVKSYRSTLFKIFRKNVLDNKNWPEPPKDGWYTRECVFTKINDLVRTAIAAKFLDGVEYLSEYIIQKSIDTGVECKVDFEAKDQGYYAVHCYIYLKNEIPDLRFDTEEIVTPIEIQITTQLQEILKQFLHTHYQTSRERSEFPEKKWQWDYKSDEFATNYLGHILHYVEGMIMGIREKQRGSER